MTSHSPLFRFLCMRPSAWLSLYLAISPAAISDHPPKADAKPIAHFTDVAAKAGLTAAVVFGGGNAKKYIIETTGTGVAIFDYDNDGWPDIFIVNGTKLEALPSAIAPTSHLYHNNHDGTFTDVTAKAGLTHTGWGQGVCVKPAFAVTSVNRSEEHTSELQSHLNLVCRLLLEKKKNTHASRACATPYIT